DRRTRCAAGGGLSHGCRLPRSSGRRPRPQRRRLRARLEELLEDLERGRCRSVGPEAAVLDDRADDDLRRLGRLGGAIAAPPRLVALVRLWVLLRGARLAGD